MGIKEVVDDGIWLVISMDYDLRYIDLEGNNLQSLSNPSVVPKHAICSRDAYQVPANDEFNVTFG